MMIVIVVDFGNDFCIFTLMKIPFVRVPIYWISITCNVWLARFSGTYSGRVFVGDLLPGHRVFVSLFRVHFDVTCVPYCGQYL